MGLSLAVVSIAWDPRGSWDGRRDDDAVRAEVADLIEDHLRATDEAGGLGDDEIGAVLWNTGREGAEKFIDRLLAAAPKRLKIRATAFLYPMDDGEPLTKSSDQTPPDNAVSDDDTAIDQPAMQDTDPEIDVSEPAAIAAPVEAKRPAVTYEPLAPALARGLSPIRRMIDIIGATIGLTLAAPVLLVAAVLIKLSDRGPVFFAQQRSGLGGRPFTIWKLRTMRTDAEAIKAKLQAQNEQDGAAFKMTHDPRVTHIGRLLRKTSIDELPQLWNVLRGEMSLVGPRPLPISEADNCDLWQKRRLDVMPGLTCIWQVEGRSRVSFIEWMRMDMRYIQRRSLWQDIRLIFATVPAVLLQRGAK